MGPGVRRDDLLRACARPQPCREAAGSREDHGHVPPDASRLSIVGRRRRAGAVAVARHRAGLRPHPAAAVLLFQSARRRQPDCRLVHKRRDLETPRDHAVGVNSRFRDRLACRRRRRFLVRAPAPGCRGIRSLRQDGQRAAARRSCAHLHAVAWPWHLVEGRARRHAGVLHRVLQRLSGRQGGQHHRAG